MIVRRMQTRRREKRRRPNTQPTPNPFLIPKRGSYLFKAILELRHVALEDGSTHEVGEEDGLEVSHLIPGSHSYLIHKFLYLEDNFMLLTIAAMISIFAPLATDNLFVVGST